MATPTTSEFFVVPINGTDLIAFYRGSNISRPLYLSYSNFLAILTQAINANVTGLLLETNGVENPTQSILNLIQGSGVTITDDGAGGITIAATGGASFITSITDTADIDLDVTLSDLTATLTTTGVTANTYGSSTQVPQITVDSKGRITGVTLVNITAGAGSVISVATAGLISGGPITVSGTITTSMNTNKLVGRGTAGTGIMEEITVGSGLTLTGAGVLNNTATPTPLGYYGAFSDVTDQFATVINTGYPMLLGVTDLSNGVTVVSGSRVTIANTGIYNIQWSGQFTNPLAAEHDVTVWLRKNGVDVPGSAGVVLVPRKHGSSDGHTLPSWNFLLDVVAGDYYEFVWSTDNISVFLSFQPAGSPPPSTASVVLTVTQQSGIMAGTGITAINSLTGSVQTLVNGTSGLAPAFSSVGTTHTLNIPLASTASVTAGLISNADYDNFAGKLSPTLANTNIFIGNISNVATGVAMSGDIGISNAGLTTIANNAVTYAKMQAVSAIKKLLGSSSTTTPVQEITPTKSINISTTNLELVNDQTSPAYPGVYGIDSTGVRNWRSDTSVRGNIPLLCMQESYPVAINQTSILYVASASKLYVCNNTSNSISIFDTNTGITLATLSTTAAFKAFYIASINEVWITSTTLTTINRISVSLNSSLGTIAAGTTNGTEAVEYSATKVFICCGNNPGTIMLINPSTLTLTTSILLNVPASPNGMVLNTNVASLQYDKIIVSAQLGVAILNPTTNLITTTVANPSSSINIGVRIRYISSTDQYIIASYFNNSIVVLDIASATTFTLNSTIRNIPGVQDVSLDEASGYIFTSFTGLTSSNVLFVSIIDLTTKNVKIKIGTNVICGAALTPGYIAMDIPNSRFFVCGRSTNTNVSTSIKYL
jgi:hypothetical protein